MSSASLTTPTERQGSKEVKGSKPRCAYTSSDNEDRRHELSRGPSYMTSQPSTMQTSFVNHGLRTWESLRKEWRRTPIGLPRKDKRRLGRQEKHILSVEITRADHFSRPVPLCDFVHALVDVWEAEAG
eukprot:TRINITY_DN9420_c0_g1_i1.p1 TRINITY_DN9420_c0_g1~~TRINITY_DN9420_c0_g1_i1.p1  ORF type:complete len:128 (-),score=20.47 TRINITY_DN9420_c0_g1_i1:220-603(-)